MATVRGGSKPALVVVDVQVGVVRDAWDAPRVIGNVALAVQRARQAGVPIFWIQHAGDELIAGSPAWEWVPELLPLPDETRVHKCFNSAFEETSFEAELSALTISHLVLAGAATNWCIRATAYAALERGYDLTLLQDAHTTSSMSLEGGFKVEAEQVVRDLNIAMTWLSYPGRKAATAAAASVEFATA